LVTSGLSFPGIPCIYIHAYILTHRERKRDRERERKREKERERKREKEREREREKERERERERGIRPISQHTLPLPLSLVLSVFSLLLRG
jgi:hypothetical protein